MLNTGNFTTDWCNHIKKKFIQTRLKMCLCRIPVSIAVQYMPLYDSPHVKCSDHNFLHGQF